MRSSLREIIKFLRIDIRELLRLELSLKEFHCAGGAFGRVGPATEYDYHVIQFLIWGIVDGQMLHLLDRILFSCLIWLRKKGCLQHITGGNLLTSTVMC